MVEPGSTQTALRGASNTSTDCCGQTVCGLQLEAFGGFQMIGFSRFQPLAKTHVVPQLCKRTEISTYIWDICLCVRPSSRF